MEEYTTREKQIIRFFNKYENLDRESRREVACYVNSKPYSWNIVYIEMINTTKLSIKMLKAMVENNFITQ